LRDQRNSFGVERRSESQQSECGRNLEFHIEEISTRYAQSYGVASDFARNDKGER